MARLKWNGRTLPLPKWPFRLATLPNPVYSLYERRLSSALADADLPAHVAVLCDGNRRWAREAGFNDVAHGHRMGALKIVEWLHWCDQLGIRHATIYLLSTENLRRDPDELGTLFEIITDVVEDIASVGSRDDEVSWHLNIAGDIDLLPAHNACRIRAAAANTAANDGMHINVAIGYGGRQEIVDAVKSLVRTQAKAGASLDDVLSTINVESISEHLYTKGQPDPDLLIRTSGEQRLSGFLLWQSAYSEIWFTEAFWPEFRKVDFLRAIRDYSRRHRRFGA